MIRRKPQHEKVEETAVTAEQYSGPVQSGEPEKQRVEVAAPSGDVEVLDVKAGSVTFFDKLKSYYHTLITVLAAILVLLNELTPITDSFGPDVKHYVSVVVVFLGALLNMLKSNEVWVNKPNTSA